MDTSEDEVYLLRVESPEDEVTDPVTLIPRHKIMIEGAANLMAQWTSHVMKCLISGLIATAVLIVFIITYLEAAEAREMMLPRRYIFFVDTSVKFTSQRSCIVESIVNLYKDVPCYLFLTSNPTLSLKLLADTYPNFYVREWNWMTSLRETPMEPWRKHPEFLRALLLNSSSEDLEMTVRFMALWKYGGTSISLGSFTGEKYEILKNSEYLSGNNVNVCDGFLISLEPCHVLAERIILEVKRKVEGGERCDAHDIFAKILRQLCPDPKDIFFGTKNCFGIRVFNESSQCSSQSSNEIGDNYCPHVKSVPEFNLEIYDSNKTFSI